jgi:hypothetical protein
MNGGFARPIPATGIANAISRKLPFRWRCAVTPAHAKFAAGGRFLDFDDDHCDDRVPGYLPFEKIDWSALDASLSELQLFDDPYLRMQATNVSIVDQFITRLEYDALQSEFNEQLDPSLLAFLNAQSQMWIFSAYELLRTWRARVKDVVKWHENGGLKLKIEALSRDEGFRHYAKELRAKQLQRVLDDSTIIDKIREDLRVSHVLFCQLEFLRISLAKHEVSGKKSSTAYAPGYGRINRWCGSLDYQMEAGQVILGNLNRRNVAEGIRSWRDRSELPTDESLAGFDAYMKLSDRPKFD